MTADLQALQELVWIRWLLVIIAISAVLTFVVIGFLYGLRDVVKRERRTFYDRGRVLLEKGELAELLNLCDRRLLEYPADGTAYWLLANAHYRRGNLNLALTCFRKVAELQPGWNAETMIQDVEAKIVASGKGPDLKIVPPAVQSTAPITRGPRDDQTS